jgi:3-oxoacyl-[acyl-carrier-protein] synthase III
MGNAMGERTGFTTARARNHEQRANVVVNGTALSVVQSSKKALDHLNTTPSRVDPTIPSTSHQRQLEDP